MKIVVATSSRHYIKTLLKPWFDSGPQQLMRSLEYVRCECTCIKCIKGNGLASRYYYRIGRKGMAIWKEMWSKPFMYSYHMYKRTSRNSLNPGPRLRDGYFITLHPHPRAKWGERGKGFQISYLSSFLVQAPPTHSLLPLCVEWSLVHWEESFPCGGHFILHIMLSIPSRCFMDVQHY